ncbi:MAG: lipocalin family protein [Myxococcota bacterium]
MTSATRLAIAISLALAATTSACDGSDPAPAIAGAPDASAPDARADTDAPAPPARCKLPADARVALPADDARHVAPGEWYYWTGHLQTDDGAWLGFQLTVLMAGAPGSAVAIAHQSITDAAAGDYRHAVAFGLDDRTPSEGFDFALGDVIARGVGGADHLRLVLDDDAVLTLDLTDVRGPIARHGDGFKDYGGGVSTFYYARPRMAASGTLRRGDATVAVHGSAWFDHQWGSLASAAASHWDWLGVQLDDGRELMVTRMPLPGGDAFGEAELTDRDCTTHAVAGADVSLVARRDWTNPETLCTYPSGWDLTVGDLHLGLEPVTLDQEMRTEPVGYWEGAAVVSGDTSGRAYVELVGYCGL